MPYFDRFDICAAHNLVEVDWHSGGWLHERPSNKRRREATHVQLARLHYKPATSEWSFEGLSENAQEIYRELCRRYGFNDVDLAGKDWTK